MGLEKRILLISCILFCFSICNAQQEVLFSQYFFSQLTINPAYAGSDDGLSLTGLSRKQWIGLNGSPTTFALIAHSPFMDKPAANSSYSGDEKSGLKNKAGVGLVLFNDHVGVSNTFIASLAYSYKILLGSGRRLSFGLQASVLNFRQEFTTLDNLNLLDPVFQENVSVTAFNVGTGVFFETDRFYVGLSVPEIIENQLNSKNTSGESQLRQYFLTSGYVFYLSRLFKLKPTSMLRYTTGMPVQFDVSANLLYRDKFWTGVSYRYENTVVAIFEMLLSQKLRLGLAYDYSLSNINIVSKGSAEFMLNYTFIKTQKRIINPRYF
jgi:type IX secretion system PorP/SprF family membrane protein